VFVCLHNQLNWGGMPAFTDDMDDVLGPEISPEAISFLLGARNARFQTIARSGVIARIVSADKNVFVARTLRRFLGEEDPQSANGESLFGTRGSSSTPSR
jgi:hypothetical protein